MHRWSLRLPLLYPFVSKRPLPLLRLIVCTNISFNPWRVCLGLRRLGLIMLMTCHEGFPPETTVNDFTCSKPKCLFQPPCRARWKTISVPLKVRSMLEDVCFRRRSPMRQSCKSSVVLRCSTLRLSCRDLELDVMCRPGWVGQGEFA